ncbi:tenascin-X-like isoform X3 [Branchiostoma floridae x Branchiostoma japonicum]
MIQPILAIPLLTVLMAHGGQATYPHRGAVQGSASDRNTCYSTRGPLSYEPSRQICCADGVYEGAEADHVCKICETTMFAIRKSSRPWRCCGRNNDQPYNPETSHCCFGQVKDGPEDTTSCFRCSADSVMSIPRDESKSYMCCGDQPYNTLREHCCAGRLNNGPESAYICQSCGDNMMSRRRDLAPLRCCGVNNEISYDPSTHHCCGGFNQPKYGPQRDYVCQRCGNTYFSRPATDGSWRCCKGRPYNPAEQHCCFDGLHSGSEEQFTCQRCGNEVFSRRRDEPEYWCCSHPKTSEMTPYNPQSQTCCNGQIFSGPDNQHSCQVCGSTPFIRPTVDEPWRCCNTVTPYSPERNHCCFGELRSGSEEQSTCVRCGKNLHTVPVNGQSWGCCGTEPFNPEREVCCNGQVYPGLVCGYEALPAPGAVLGLTAESVDMYSVGLRWYSPSNTQGLFGYRIFYQSASGGQENVVDTRSLDTSYTLSGLQPNSQYIIHVLAYGIAGDGQRSNTLRVQTAPETGGSTTPAQFVQAMPRDSDSVDLEWNAPAGITADRVRGFRILYKQTTETNTAYLDVGRPVTDTSFTLGGLEPYTDYDIVIVTIDDTGASSHSMPVRVRTAEGTPGPPGSLQRTAVGSNRLQVAWEPPASVNGVLEGYRLYYQVRGEDSPRVVQLGPESTRYTLTSLESNTQYIVWVSAFTGAGEGLRSGNIAVRTSGGIPGPVRSLRGDPISPTSVRVQWETPTYNADGVQGYRLYYMQVGGRDIPAITLEGNLQSYILSGLQPNSGYEIWLVAFSPAGDGQESPHITVRTGSSATPVQPQLPGTPQDVRVSAVDPFTILVHWQPPTSGGDISNYLVYYQVADENRAFSVQSGANERSHLLGGLQPDTQYLIWIVGVSPVGVGQRSPAVRVQTQDVDVLPDAPRGLEVTPIGPTMIRVQWVPPGGGGTVSGYRIYYQAPGQPSSSLEADASERTRIIGQLLPNTEYTVWLLAFNEAGDGSETQRFIVRTTAAVPGFVPRINVTAIDDTTLWVSWQAPETGAPVRGYRIYYQAVGGDQMTSQVETGPLEQSQAVSGLEPGIEYIIWIVAFSNQGDSEDSPRVRIRTGARVPDSAQILPEIRPVAGDPGIPQDIQGTSLSSSSIQVQWQEPATNAAPSGYRVYYQVVGDAMISFEESGAERRILILEDLQPNTDYNIWVTAYSPAGMGQRSARTTVRTLQETPQLPGVPDDVRVVDVGQTSIHVQWQRPRAGGKVTGYRIYYQPENQVSATEDVVNPSTLSYIIPGLQPDMEYTIWVVALSSLGMGLRSPLVTVRTEPTDGGVDYPPEVPGMPEDVTAYATSAVSIRVEWQTPALEDRVSGYRIRYQAEGDPAISTIEVDREERSYDIMALTPETDYTVWVVAFSPDGMGLRSPKVHARTPEDVPALPGSPARIQARPTDMATVLVEWGQPTSAGRVDGYRIYYQAINDPQVASIDVGPQTLSQSVGGLESGTEYTFWVQAVNAAGLGYRSPVVTAITDAPAPSLPGLPQNVQATALSPTTILVEWEAPSLGGVVQGYMVYHQSREGGTTLREVGPSVNSLILSDLRPETRYSIWVVAHSDAGMGLRSSMKTLQTPSEGPRLPGRPMNVLATALDAKSILVEWQQPTFGGPLDQYRIYYEKSPDQTTSMVEVGPGTVSYTLMDLLPDTEYSIWVVGLSNVGMGERSPIIAVTTLEEAPRLPDTLSNVRVSPAGPTSITVEWEAPTEADVQGYEIYYQTDNLPATSVEMGPDDRYYTISDLLPDQEYTVWLVALTFTGRRVSSQTFTIQTEPQALPGVPQNVRAFPTGPTSIVVQWQLPTTGPDVQGYRIYYQAQHGHVSSVEVGPDTAFYTVTDLMPDTEYTVWVIAFSAAGMGDRSGSLSVRTEEEAPKVPGAPDSVRLTPSGPTSITVEWEAPTTGADVEGYNVYYQPEDGSTRTAQVEPSDMPSYTITGLNPNTRYTVWVIAFSSEGLGQRSQMVNLMTEDQAPATPGAPGSVRLTPSGPTSITVEWETPSTGGDVEYYVIYYQAENEPTMRVQVSPSDIPYTIRDLLPDTQYTIWIVAFSTEGMGERSPALTVSTREAPATPGAPGSVRLTPSGPTSITVEWETPSTGGDVEYYVIYYQAENEPTMRVQVSPSDIPYTIRDLLPDTQYTIWIVAFSTEGMGERSPALTVSTREAPATPGAPGSVRLTPSGPTSITVEWETPSTGGDVEYYVIYYQAENEPTMRVQVSPSDIPYTIRDLLPDTQYTIWIVAFSTEGMGERSPALTVSTQEEAPATPGAPGSVRLTPSGPTSITVEWETPSTGGDVEYYVIYYQAENEPTMRVQVSPSDIPYTIRDLLPDTQYTIWIVAFSTEGMGERSPALTVSTQEAPATPGAPGSVRLTPSGPTSITVEWETPSTGGDVEYYVIYYQAENEPTMRVQVSPSDIPYTIRDLLPDTQYTIWIVAFSTEGMGERSPALTVSTREAPATPGAPGSVRLTPSGPTSITVEWEAPSTGGDVEYYVIYYQAENEPTMRVQVSPSDIPYTIRDLLPDTQYTIWIVAFSTEGMGERSPALTVSTQEEAPATPGAPGSVRLTPSGPTSITVEWETPSTGGDVEYYVIYYQAENEPTMRVQVSPSDIPYTIRDLLPDTQYTIWIVAFSTEGMGERSPALTVSTQEEAPATPGAPGSVRLTPSGPTSITVEWETPSTGGDVEYYVIYYQAENEPTMRVQVSPSDIPYTIRDLLPDTQYTIWIVAFSTEGMGERSPALSVSTQEAPNVPGAPGSVHLTPSGPTSITVEWETPTTGADVEYYVIYYQTEDEPVLTVQLDQTTRQYTIQDLLPNTPYTVWIVAFSAEGEGERSSVYYVQTAAEAEIPGAPGNVQVTPFNATALTVEWEAPTRGGDFQGYRIYYEAPGDSTPGFVDTPSSVTSFLLTGLQPDTTYNVWVLAFSPAGMSQRSLMKTLTTMQVARGPSAPAFIRASPLDGTSLVVEWEASESDNVQGYIIYYQAETETSPSSVETDPTTLQSTIRGLQPDTTYTVWVVTYSPDGTSPNSPTVSIRTLQEGAGLPGSPEGLRVRAVNPTTALLSWQEPSSGADFDGYRVYYQRAEDPESVTTLNVRLSTTSYILENLQPGQKYQIWITAYSSRGISEVTQRIDLRMPQGSLPGAPLNVRASSTEPTSIVIQWDSPRSGGDVERYQIYYRSSEDSSVSQIPVGGDEQTWTITGLQADLDYMVWIEAVNSAGSGPRTDVLNVQTPSEAPGEPENLQVESTELTSVTITWEAPTSGGELEGYRIYYQRVGDDGMRSPTRVIGPDERSFTLTGLEEDTDYRIYLVPFSSDRVGTSSPVLSVRTQSTPTPQPPGAPLSIRASAVDSSSVRVTWRHPTRGGAAAGYKVHYQVAGEPEAVTVEVRPTDRALMLSGLRPSTSYDIWMTAFSSAGSSPRTPSVMVRTPEMAPQTPGRPRSIRAETVNPTTMLVQWQEPVRGADLVERYRVYYQASRAPTPSFRVAQANERSLTIPGMASSTTYNIWVVALSAAGVGQPSPSLTLATPDAVPEVPGSPEDIQVSLEDDSSIRVEWLPPTSGGEVLGYRINYQEAGNEEATTIEVRSNVYSQVIRELKPDTEYYIWVFGFSAAGDGRRSQILSVTMESEGSTQLGPPADLQVSLLDDESVLLQWSAPEASDGILGYRLYYQPVGSTDVSNLEVGPDVSSHPIRGLEPGVDYVVWIVAFTQEGEGLRSAKMNVRIDRQVIGGSTYPGQEDRINIIPGVVVREPSSGSRPDQEDRYALLGLPASPENVQVARVDATTMRVQWMPPTTGGRVAGYRIYYQGPDDDESRSIETPPSARTQTITGLAPGVDYNIWVLAFSPAGMGPQSDSFTIRTYPQGEVPRAPADVQMAVVNPSTIRLNWEPPTGLSGPILGYRIFYNPILTNMLNVQEVGPTVTEYSLMNLDPYLGYNIWVLAFTEAREGQRSLSIMLPPRAQRGSSVGGSASPREVTFTALTPNSIKIQWEKPTDSVDVVDGYGILYRGAGEDQTQTIEVGVDESEYILTGLEADTEYVLQLLAFTASGQEYRSPQISVRTSASSHPDLGRVGVSGSTGISSTAHMSVVPSSGGTGRVIVRGGGDAGPRLTSGQSFVIRTDANGQRSFLLPDGESAAGQGVVIRTDGSSTSNGQVFLVPANGGSTTGQGGQTFVVRPNQGGVITNRGGSGSSGGQAFLVPVGGSSGGTRDGQTVVHRFNGRPDDALQSGQTATTPAPEEGHDEDCYHGNGEDYRGQASTTEKGSQCVKWSASDFFQYSSHEYTQGEFGIGDHNYCRNPDGDAKPWCYADAEGTYEYCAIQQCRNGG